MNMFLIDINFILFTFLKLLCVAFLVLVRRFFIVHTTRKLRKFSPYQINAARINRVLEFNRLRNQALDKKATREFIKKHNEQIKRYYKNKNTENLVFAVVGGIICLAIFMAVGRSALNDNDEF